MSADYDNPVDEGDYQPPGELEEEDLRYDNASVERALDMRENEQQQQMQQQQQHQVCQQMSISTSSSSSNANTKAKSAPATPCNVTPTAFHQHRNGDEMANTLPPDIGRNISATCARVLPRSSTMTTNTTTTTTTLNCSAMETLDQLSGRGELALRDKDYLTAVRLFSRCLKLATDNSSSGPAGSSDYLKKNFKLYARRAEAHFKLARYHEANEDSIAARELNPKWSQAYYLQGKSQFMIGEHPGSLAVFAFGLTQEPTSQCLFEALLEAALNYSANNFCQDFETKLAKLKALKLERRPFVVLSLLGQELLAKGHSRHAVVVLESALKINTSLEISVSPALTTNNNNNNNSTTTTSNNNTAASSSSSTTSSSTTTTTSKSSTSSLSMPSTPTASGATQTPLTQNNNNGSESANQQRRFKSSVLSTIAMAHCSMHDYDKAISYMLKELDIESELEDVAGQCRVLSNLGYTYYKTRQFNASLEAHRKQLNMAMKTHLFEQASRALNAIGHVHVARNDYASALTSHTRCLDILKQLGNNHYVQFKEMLAIGHIATLMNDFSSARERYNEAVQLIKTHNNNNNNNINNKSIDTEFLLGSIMVNFDMAHLALKRQQYHEARDYYQSVIKLSQSLSSSTSSSSSSHYKARLSEMRACNGLGHTFRMLKQFEDARQWFEKQLHLAETLDCHLGKSQALCNLGMISQHFEDHQRAWRLFNDNLKLVERQPHLKAYAYSYLASAYFLMNRYHEALTHYEISLNLFRDLEHCSGEQKSIELNMAFVQERMGHSSLEVTNNTTINQAAHTKKVMMMAP